MHSRLSAKRSLSIQPKISWCLSAQWSPKHQNKHGSTRPDLHKKFLPSQDLLKSKAGFTETPASYATSTPEQKNQKSQNSQIKRVTGEIKMFHCLPTGWIKAKRCASILISQIRCCSIHGLYFIFPFFFPLSFKCKPHCLSNTEGKVSSWWPQPWLLAVLFESQSQLGGGGDRLYPGGRIHTCTMLWLASAALTWGEKNQINWVKSKFDWKQAKEGTAGVGFKGCIPMTAASSQVGTQDRTHQHQNQLLERQKGNRGFRGPEVLKWE